MNFMSIEVAVQNFLFRPSNTGFNPSDIDGFFASQGRAPTNVPFSHNHLHDLESLWWVAVWMVFYNKFSGGTSSCAGPFTLQDVQAQLTLAGNLFPPILNSATRRDGFQLSDSFQKACDKLPDNKTAICRGLDFLRRLLISHYNIIEANWPVSVDPNSSNDDIYDNFIRLFSKLKDASHDVNLDYIPDIHAKLLKEEKKRTRSDSATATVVGRKAPRK